MPRVWGAKEAQKIVSYTKSIGGAIAAAILFNESNIPTAGGAMNKNYNATDLVKDESVFHTCAKSIVPEMLVLRPGSIGDGVTIEAQQRIDMSKMMMTTDALLSAEHKPVIDIFTYHFYGVGSMRRMRRHYK